MNPPPFCPNRQCSAHEEAPKPHPWYRLAGTYLTIAFGLIQRFVCTLCDTGFSSQTFSVDYYAKRTVDYRAMLRMLKSGSSTRDISRDLKVSTATVANRFTRLARQAIAAHQELTDSLALSEQLVADGFESFTTSQYFPNNINVLIGKNSQYVYGLSYLPLRRKGVMTEKQKQRRDELDELYRPDEGAAIGAFSRLCDTALGLFDRSELPKLILHTDEHPAYVGAIREHPRLQQLIGKKMFLHHRVNSDHPRVPGGPLFSVDYIDREFRKDLANHVRETVKFARNVNDCMARMVVYLAHHNFKKVYRIRHERSGLRTHAEIAGAAEADAKEAWS